MNNTSTPITLNPPPQVKLFAKAKNPQGGSAYAFVSLGGQNASVSLPGSASEDDEIISFTFNNAMPGVLIIKTGTYEIKITP
jgi:hypothetical protein